MNNKTEKYLLSAVGMKLERLQRVVGNRYFTALKILQMYGYQGCYSYWWRREYNPEEIYIYFSPSDDVVYSTFRTLVKYFQGLTTFVKICIPKRNTVIVVLTLEKKWRHCKELVLAGKYSKLGKAYAVDFFGTDPPKLQYHLILKTDAGRKYLENRIGEFDELDEYEDIPKKEEETLYI